MKETRLNFVFIFLVGMASYFAISQGVNMPKVIDGGTPYTFNTKDITDMYADYVEKWKQEIKISFEKAEQKILDKKPSPDVVGPDPDPDKCICGGSGWIEQGDGHKTKCPYHGEGMQDIIGKHGLIIRKY